MYKYSSRVFELTTAMQCGQWWPTVELVRWSQTEIFMRKIKTVNKMVELVNKAYPNARAVPLSEFYDDPSRKGIWFKGSEDCDVVPTKFGWSASMFDYYNAHWVDTSGVHPKFDKFMKEHGWYCEPYDAGTLMAYPEW